MRPVAKTLLWLVLGLFLVCGITLAAGFTYEHVSRGRASAKFPAPGKMIPVAERMVHLRCTGHGTPTVILEHGTDTYGSMAWQGVQQRIAETTQVCSYDRAGYLWSDPVSTPRDAATVALELHELLTTARVTPPYVIVGHSLGAAYAMVFAGSYPREVSGLVLVDGTPPKMLTELPEKFLALTVPRPPSSFSLSLLTDTGLVRLLSAKNATTKSVPAEVNEVSLAFSPESMRGMFAELASIRQSLDQADGARLGDMPLAVLSAGSLAQWALLPLDATTREQAERSWRKLQADLSLRSSRGENCLVSGAGHYIQFDRPQVVQSTILAMIKIARGDAQTGEQLCSA
jgi:pimeloyl-ACP methyl ester carboxylesterase